MSPMLRDKLITHMLVLILHCDNFKTMVDSLTVDFKIGRERLVLHFTTIHIEANCFPYYSRNCYVFVSCKSADES